MNRQMPLASESRRAFTLLEMVVALLIIAILASVSVLSFRGSIDRHRLEQGVDLVARFDARLRRESIRANQPIRATIRRDRGEFVIPDRGVSWALPGPVALDAFRVASQVSARQSVELASDRFGQSASYAVKLRAGKFHQWLVVLGGSGQVIRVSDEDQVESYLEPR
ncbi:MAG: prepilin-type N-terminal cleavage/methylation domain-containing protein [Planctomycetota bacterium]